MHAQLPPSARPHSSSGSIRTAMHSRPGSQLAQPLQPLEPASVDDLPSVTYVSYARRAGDSADSGAPSRSTASSSRSTSARAHRNGVSALRDAEHAAHAPLPPSPRLSLLDNAPAAAVQWTPAPPAPSSSSSSSVRSSGAHTARDSSGTSLRGSAQSLQRDVLSSSPFSSSSSYGSRPTTAASGLSSQMDLGFRIEPFNQQHQQQHAARVDSGQNIPVLRPSPDSGNRGSASAALTLEDLAAQQVDSHHSSADLRRHTRRGREESEEEEEDEGDDKFDVDDLDDSSSDDASSDRSSQQQQQHEHKEQSSVAAPSAAAAFPRGPNAKLSHRLILERLYGKERAKKLTTTPAPDSSRFASTPRGSSAPHASSRGGKRAALLSLNDGLVTPGSQVRIQAGTATLLSGPSNSRPSTAAAATPLARTSHSQSAAMSTWAGSASETSYRTPLAFTRHTHTSRDSTTPRLTQRAHAQRLSDGRTIVAVPEENNWAYLTALRHAQEQARFERLARASERLRARDGTHPPGHVAPSTSGVSDAAHPSELSTQPAPLHPAHARQGGALPSAKRSRRPPAQCSFHEAALGAGVVQPVSRTTASLYRMDRAAPAAFQLASEPRLVSWRLDTGAWLNRQGRTHVARAVNSAQMAELRVLYEALDVDGSDALDARELAAALRVCGLRDDAARELAGGLLEAMGKGRHETLSFAQFAQAVCKYDVPVHAGGDDGALSSGSPRRVRGQFGTVAARQTEPLFARMMHDGGGGRTSFSQAVLEFKRHRLYEQMHKGATEA